MNVAKKKLGKMLYRTLIRYLLWCILSGQLSDGIAALEEFAKLCGYKEVSSAIDVQKK